MVISTPDIALFQCSNVPKEKFEFFWENTVNINSDQGITAQIKSLRKKIVLLKADQKAWNHIFFFERIANIAGIQILSQKKQADLVIQSLSGVFFTQLNDLQEKLQELQHTARLIMEDASKPRESPPPTEYPKKVVTEKEAADYLGFHVGHLARLRRMGKGPPYLRVGGGKSIRYQIKDLDDYLTTNTVAS